VNFRAFDFRPPYIEEFSTTGTRAKARDYKLEGARLLQPVFV